MKAYKLSFVKEFWNIIGFSASIALAYIIFISVLESLFSDSSFETYLLVMLCTSIFFLVLISLIVIKYCSENIIIKEMKAKEEREYYENGKLKAEYVVYENRREGIEKIFHENGNLKSETEYENGLKNGVAKLYSEDGKLIREIKYKKGEMEVK